MNSYKFTEPNFESVSIVNFLPEYYIDCLLDTYRRTQKNISKNYGKDKKVTEIFLPTRGCDKNIQVIYEDVNHKQTELPVPTPVNTKKFIGKLRKLIINKFETSQIKLGLYKLCIHNLNGPLQIHCDGIDIENRYNPRPENFDLENKFPQDNKPGKDLDMFNQGLITLKNDNLYNGTVIFDQWYPISSYLFSDTEYNERENKTLIKFYKNETWKRFGEKIRLNTKQEISKADWNNLQQAVEDPQILNKSEFTGLSIDKILHFGQPGTCSAWANKKYHASLPTKTWSRNRLNLQFETYKIKR
jgi:hypothetical protein